MFCFFNRSIENEIAAATYLEDLVYSIYPGVATPSDGIMTPEPLVDEQENEDVWLCGIEL